MGDAPRRPPAAEGPEFTVVPLDRRRFLVLVGGVAALRALEPTLAWAKRAATLPALQPWKLPDAIPGQPIEAARALTSAAILAPSHWNAQPWRFEVDSGELRVLLDAQRTLPLDDPDQRFAQMSLGAALENLLVAADSSEDARARLHALVAGAALLLEVPGDDAGSDHRTHPGHAIRRAEGAGQPPGLVKGRVEEEEHGIRPGARRGSARPTTTTPGRRGSRRAPRTP